MIRSKPTLSEVCPAVISVLIDSPLGIVLGPMADQYLAIDEEVDLCRETATRATKTLSRSPPLAPAAPLSGHCWRNALPGSG